MKRETIATQHRNIVQTYKRLRRKQLYVSEMQTTEEMTNFWKGNSSKLNARKKENLRSLIKPWN